MQLEIFYSFTTLERKKLFTLLTSNIKHRRLGVFEEFLQRTNCRNLYDFNLCHIWDLNYAI